MNGTGTCRAEECRAPLLWRRNIQTGKRVPLDAVPPPGEERLVCSRKHFYVLIDGERCRPASVDEWNDWEHPVYISHFRTCPGVRWFADRKDR